ncbi:MAG: ADP-ribosylglycohydrolase family protein, partial [Alicyclobacillus sp.]|nr:ADP-ribosylglycohydrolase family protein [Alicyclobacillus sp.]
MDLSSRIRGGLWGLLVADAVGVPYEFHAMEHLPPLAQIDLVPPKGFQPWHAGIPRGTWSDDGAQALCLADSLLAMGRLDLDDFANRLIAWHDHGLWAVDGR